MRIKNYLKNLKMGIIRQILTEILRFAVRTVFIYTLSVEFLGINGLFVGIFAVFGVVELGFGNAVLFMLYEPLAKQNIEEIKSLMNLCKKAYRYVSLCIFILTLITLPFLEYIINGYDSTVNIYLIFLVFAIKMISNYLFFAYKTLILYADQKKYVVFKYLSIAQIFICIFQIAGLYFLRDTPEISFYFYNIIQVIITLVFNFITAKNVDKLYPYLKEKNIKKLDSVKKQYIFKNIKALSISKLSTGTMKSIDSIVISAMITGGTALLGIYSNYLVIVTSVNAFISIVLSSMDAGIGNYYVTESKEKNKDFLMGIDLAVGWIHGFVGVCFFVLMNPFIGDIWLNDNYLLSEIAVFLIALTYIIGGTYGGTSRYIVVAGLYYEARIKYIISAVLNIVLSVLLVALGFGIEGVILATVMCTFGANSFLPYIVAKHVFKESSKSYYIYSLRLLLLVVSTALLTKYLAEVLFTGNDIFAFLGKSFICVLVPNITWYIIYRKTESFSFLIRKLKQMFNSIKK